MTTHAFSNGTSAQLTVHLEEDLHVFIGGALRLVATKEEVSLFLSDLQSWAGRVFPVESQGTNGAPEMSTPEAEPYIVCDMNLPPAAPVVPESSPVVPQSSPVVPELETLPSLHEIRQEVVTDISVSLEMVLAAFVENKPTAVELSRAVDNVSRELFAQAVEQAGSMVPAELKPVFDLVRSL